MSISYAVWRLPAILKRVAEGTTTQDDACALRDSVEIVLDAWMAEREHEGATTNDLLGLYAVLEDVELSA